MSLLDYSIENIENVRINAIYNEEFEELETIYNKLRIQDNYNIIMFIILYYNTVYSKQVVIYRNYFYYYNNIYKTYLDLFNICLISFIISNSNDI